MGSRVRRGRGEIPLDLVAVIVLVAAALIWALRGSLLYTAMIVVFCLGAIVWAFARRIGRHDEAAAGRQRKVRHDASKTNEREEE